MTHDTWHKRQDYLASKPKYYYSLTFGNFNKIKHNLMWKRINGKELGNYDLNTIPYDTNYT